MIEVILNYVITHVSAKRPPDFVVGSEPVPYLRRWWVIPRNSFFNIYFHEFLRSDEDRALHDHMYVNLSLILAGEYKEHTILAGGINQVVTRKAGQWCMRWPSTAHRLEIDRPCHTLFITGPRVRNWGFHCPKGWRRWQDFTAAENPGEIGRGCD